MSTTFYIVRHGQSEGNINGDIYGTDPPLTPKGLEQAEALAQVLHPITLDHIFASTLTRAKQTAQVIASKKNLPVIEHDRIKERFFGKLEGRKYELAFAEYEDVYDQFQNLTLEKQMQWKVVDDMETWESVLERVLSFLDELAQKHKGKTMLMVTHAHVLLALLAHFQFVTSMNQLPYGSILNTAYIKVEYDAGKFKISEVFGITKKEI